MNSDKSIQSKDRLSQTDIHEQWERNYLAPELESYYNATFARIVGELDDHDGKTILDLGCGYCYHTKRLAKSRLSITAADFSEPALARARLTLAEAGIEDRVTLRQADATDLRFPDGAFDNVLIWGVLMHIPEAEKALSEAARVLRSGGKLVLSENNALSFDVVIFERLINIVKRLIGRTPHERRRTRLGIEEWQAGENGSGLMVRKTNMPALVTVCRNLGLVLDTRFAGQFTEAYTRAPSKLMKRAIHTFNQFYFHHVGWPGPAMTNILIFRKQ